MRGCTWRWRRSGGPSTPAASRPAQGERASGAQRLQPFPIEIDAVPRAVGRDREPVADFERMREETVETKAVRLEVGAVGHRSQAMHGDVVRAVGSDGKIE